MKFAVIALIAASLSLAVASAAPASTVGAQARTFESLNVSVRTRPTAWDAVDVARSGDLPVGSAWAEGQVGTSVFRLPSALFRIDPGGNQNAPLDPCRNACSPWYGGVFGTGISNAGAPGWETAAFWTVFAPGEGAYATRAVLGFSTVQAGFSMLWGSPDRTNLIEFMLGTDLMGSFAGANFVDVGLPGIVQSPGQGAVLASFGGLNFDSIRFTTAANGGAFEFSNLAATPSQVPLPAGVVLLLTGLMAIAGIARRTRG